ncbi:GDSL-type esterase/lipase family protein [Bacillus sp. DJP31]|uniref:GDSL-type esterase/lipase family protein n=1 Tax=Bacillus sp. DJP31 TaxID=3409789 RepID=UPI003BB7A996
MKYNKFVSALVIFSIACFLLLSVGFVKGVNSVLDPGTNSTQSMDKPDEQASDLKEKKLIVAIGDSLTRGVGDSEGLGYTERVKTILKNDFNQEIVLSNLAIGGLTTSGLLDEFKKESVLRTLTEADAIFLTIGGNDLFPGADQLSAEYLASYRPDEVTFKNNLDKIVSIIRSENKNVPIYAYGYYNPFHNVPGLDVSSAFVSKWNDLLEQSLLTTTNTYVIPTFDIFYNEEDRYLYTDHFHPNAEGYTQMAERLGAKFGSQLGDE